MYCITKRAHAYLDVRGFFSVFFISRRTPRVIDSTYARVEYSVCQVYVRVTNRAYDIRRCHSVVLNIPMHTERNVAVLRAICVYARPGRATLQLRCRDLAEHERNLKSEVVAKAAGEFSIACIR